MYVHTPRNFNRQQWNCTFFLLFFNFQQGIGFHKEKKKVKIFNGNNKS